MILQALNISYYYFKYKFNKSLNTTIDKSSKDYEKNMDLVLCRFYNNVDDVQEDTKEAIANLIKVGQFDKYIEVYNSLFFTKMIITIFALSIISLIVGAMFGFHSIIMLKSIVIVEILLSLWSLFYTWITRFKKGTNI